MGVIGRVAGDALHAVGDLVVRLVRQPLRLVLLVLQAAATVVAIAQVAGQMEQPAVRTLSVLVLAILGLFALVVPDSAGPLVFIIGCGFLHLVLTAFAGALDDEPGGTAVAPPLVPVLVLAAALYLIHAVAALRAIVPPAGVGAPEVVLRWALRLAEALVPGLLIGALALLVPSADVGGGFWLVGGAAVVALVAIPSLAVRPRPWRTPPLRDLSPGRPPP